MKKIALLTGLYLLLACPVWGKVRIEVTHVVATKYAVGGYQSGLPRNTRIIVKRFSADKPKFPSPTVTPTRTYYDDIYDTVHLLESTRGAAVAGHHIDCRQRGMWNEIGYAPQSEYCFKNEEEGKARLIAWFRDKLERGFSVWEAACLWNTGRRTANCSYAKHF